MGILQTMNQLKQISSGEKVLSLYLNTDPTDPDQQGGKWKTMLKSGLQQIEQSLKEKEAEDELKSFQKVRDEVEKYVLENERHLKRAVVVFAATDQSIWFAERLQIRVKSAFHWEEKPVIDQLETLVKDYAKSGLILVQHNEIQVIETLLNETTPLKDYELDIETEDWKEKVGPRQGFHSSGLGAHNAQVDNYEKRFEANQHRWFKSIAGKLDKLAKDQEWEKIYIVGETNVAHELDKAMNKEVERVIHKNMLGQKEDQILEAVFTE